MSLQSPGARLRASLLLLLVAFIWGSAFVAQKTAFDAPADGGGESGMGVLAFTGARFLLGALVVAPFMLAERRRARPPEGGGVEKPGDWARYLGIGLVLFLASVFQQQGIVETTVTNAGFLTAIYVPLVPVVAFLGFRRSVPPVLWPGALGCLAGAWLLTGGANAGLSALGSGDAWVLAGALFWALHVTLVGQVVGRAGRPLTLAFGQFVACGVLGLGGAALVETPTWAGIMGAAPEIVYAGVLSVGVAFTLQVVAQRNMHPAGAAIILSTEMVFAALAGALLLGERLTPDQMAGAALILGCILAVEVTTALRPAMGRG
jgi:drug/metabolite transporter (DMT)-like permease